VTALLTRAVAAVLLAAGLGAAAAPATDAAFAPQRSDDTSSAQTTRLCTGSPVPCSIQVDPVWPEDSTGEVAVTGRPGMEVGVRAYRVTVDDERVVTLQQFGPRARVRIDDNGFGSTDLRLPAVAAGASGGPVLVALDDSKPGDPSRILGTWSVLASRYPLVLGDGFGDAKPVGVTLDLELTAAPAGATYDVRLGSQGQWESIRAGKQEACADPAGTCVVSYVIPRGLDATAHQVRLVDEASGIPVAEWRVLPSATGRPLERSTTATVAVGSALAGSLASGAGSRPVPRPRSGGLDLPDAVVGSSGSQGHDVRTVRWAAGALGVIAALACLAMVVPGGRSGRSGPVGDAGRERA
jgi:hypothetical protein